MTRQTASAIPKAQNAKRWPKLIGCCSINVKNGVARPIKTQGTLEQIETNQNRPGGKSQSVTVTRQNPSLVLQIEINRNRRAGPSRSITSSHPNRAHLLQIEILFERLETRSPSGKADRPTASPRRHTEDRATAARAWANPAIPDISSLFRTFLARFRTLSANVRKRDRHVRDGICPTAVPQQGPRFHSRVP